MEGAGHGKNALFFFFFNTVGHARGAFELVPKGHLNPEETGPGKVPSQGKNVPHIMGVEKLLKQGQSRPPLQWLESPSSREGQSVGRA